MLRRSGREDRIPDPFEHRRMQPLRPTSAVRAAESAAATTARWCPTSGAVSRDDAALGLRRASLLALVDHERQQRETLQVLVVWLVQLLSLHGRVEPCSTASEILRQQYRSLTPRQREVLTLVVEGHPNKRIACRLAISQRTVETHRAAVMRKCGCTSVPALARWKMAIDQAHD